MVVNFRQAHKEDLEQIYELIKYAFDEPGFYLEQMKKWFDIIYKEHYICIENGKLVTTLRCIPLQQNIRGIFKPMGGVAMVATAPEFRQKGYYKDLMKFAFNKMKDENIAVSTLYPFKDLFYKKFGYVNAKPHQFIKINPLMFSRWKELPNGYTLKRINIEEGVKELQQLQEHTVSKFTGGVKRSEDRWNELTKDYPSWLVLAYNSENEIEGAMYYDLKGYGDRIFGADNIGSMKRIGLFTRTLQARHALFHYLYSHSDQIIEVYLPIYPHEDNIESWIDGFIKTEIHQHFINMVRIVNVKQTLQDLPVKFEGSLTIEVNDPFCDWNNGLLTLKVNDNKILPIFSPDETMKVKISIEGLTALVYGLMSVEEVEYFNWLKNATTEDITLLKEWFPRGKYCCTEFY